MPYHTFDHPYNTKYRKDPAIERWVYQRYYGQFGKFQVSWRSMKWLALLYGVIPYGLYQWNERTTRWVDSHRDEDINAVRMGRISARDLRDFD